jgi:hypothetical protein
LSKTSVSSYVLIGRLMERRRSPGVLPSCDAGLIGLAVRHDFVMVFAAITLAATRAHHNDY